MKHRHGFTLIELLVVMGIVALLMGLMIPAFNNVAQGKKIAESAGLISSVFTEARSRAVNGSRRVEVRLFKTTVDGVDVYQALQIYDMGADGEAYPSGDAIRLPQGVAISESHSTLVDEAGGDGPRVGTDGITGGQKNLKFIAFGFQPSGPTDLAAMSPSGKTWYLTAVPVARIGDAPADRAKPPCDLYSSVQIDAVAGVPRTFLP